MVQSAFNDLPEQAMEFIFCSDDDEYSDELLDSISLSHGMEQVEEWTVKDGDCLMLQ